MRRFALTKDLVTGLPDIDEHHRTILELGNKVIDLSAIKTNNTIFTDALRYLADYVIYHFAAEECVMVATRYPNHDHHRQWHERFKCDISDYCRLAEGGDISQDLRLKISFAIENWLLEHVRITDRELAKFLREKGEAVPIRLPNAHDLTVAGKLPHDVDERLKKSAVADRS